MGMFNQNNFNSNQNNGFGQQPQGEKKSWKVGRDNVRNSTGKMKVGLYETEYKNAFCTIQILQSIGSDPNTGVSTYESRPPKEIPSVLLSHETLEAIVDRFTDKTRPTKDSEFFPNWVEPTNVNETIDCGRKTKIQFIGSPSDIKIRIESDGQDRTIVLTGVQLSTGPNFAMWRMFLQKLYYVLSYMRTSGIDPEKFSAAMGSTAGGITLTRESEDAISTNSNDVPFAV